MTQDTREQTKILGVADKATNAKPKDAAALEQALFSAPVEPDREAPTVAPEDLTGGALVRRAGERPIKWLRDGKQRQATLWMFSLVGEPDTWFSVFGNVNLDSQLKKVRPGAAILLRYTGKDETDDGRTAHTWELRYTTANDAQLQQLLQSDAWRSRLEDVHLAIAQAKQREAERRQARSAGPDSGAPPHTDDDLPF